MPRAMSNTDAFCVESTLQIERMLNSPATVTLAVNTHARYYCDFAKGVDGRRVVSIEPCIAERLYGFLSAHNLIIVRQQIPNATNSQLDYPRLQ